MEVISKVVFLSLKDGKASWNKFDNNLFTFILQHELYLYNKTKVTYNGQRKHVKTSIELSKRFLCHQNNMLLYKPLSSVCKIMHLSYRFGVCFWRTSRFPFRKNAIHFCILFVVLSESNFSLYFNVSLFFVHVLFAFVKLALKSVEKKSTITFS